MSDFGRPSKLHSECLGNGALLELSVWQSGETVTIRIGNEYNDATVYEGDIAGAREAYVNLKHGYDMARK